MSLCNQILICINANIFLCLLVRYGHCHPHFYIGSFNEALEEASAKTAKDVCSSYLNIFIEYLRLEARTRKQTSYAFAYKIKQNMCNFEKH